MQPLDVKVVLDKSGRQIIQEGFVGGIRSGHLHSEGCTMPALRNAAPQFD